MVILLYGHVRTPPWCHEFCRPGTHRMPQFRQRFLLEDMDVNDPISSHRVRSFSYWNQSFFSRNHLKPVRNFRRISQDIFSCSSVASFNNQKKTLRNFARGVMQAPVDVALVIPWNVVKAMPFAPSPSHHRHHHIFIDKYICLPFPVSRVVKMTLF